MQTDLFVSEAESLKRDLLHSAEIDDYIAQGWARSADQARRDGFPDAAQRYEIHASRWRAYAVENRQKAAQLSA